MPRRRLPHRFVPPRPDGRRGGGNGTTTQRRPRPRRGQLEAIAERRVRALELRKQGRSYREIGRELGVDVHTAHADVGAELHALRETAVSEATELRALELERLDAMHAGLWPQILKGSPPAVSAGVRVSERRSRLVGLDAPTTSKTEVTTLSPVAVDPRHREWVEGLHVLELEELEDLQRQQDRLIDDALARIRARKLWLSAPAGTLPAAPVEVGGTGAPIEPAIDSEVTGIESPAAEPLRPKDMRPDVGVSGESST